MGKNKNYYKTFVRTTAAVDKWETLMDNEKPFPTKEYGFRDKDSKTNFSEKCFCTKYSSDCEFQLWVILPIVDNLSASSCISQQSITCMKYIS